MRRSEVCALTWDDIDLKNKTVRVDEKTKGGDSNGVEWHQQFIAHKADLLEI